MKRIFALCLALLLAVSAAPARAADVPENPFPAIRTYKGFPDVAEDAWYADAVKVCYETGLMNGSGGQFRPEATLTAGEAEALAARIHHILNGGDGVIPTAPKGTGTCALLYKDGSALDERLITSYTSSRPEGWGVFTVKSDGSDPKPLHLLLDERYRVDCTVETSKSFDEITYRFPVDEETLARCDPFVRLLERGTPDAWYWGADLYLKALPGAGDTAFSYRLDWRTIPRDGFFSLLNLVCPDSLLTPINQINHLPDTADAAVLRFYNAGILTGTDGYGTFSPREELTRAQAAVMVARLLRPALRERFTPKTDGLPYTLTPLPLDRYQYGARPYGDVAGVLEVYDIREGSAQLPLGLLTWDGAWLLAPEYDRVFRLSSDGAALVEKGGLYGYIDADGRWIIPCAYEKATIYHDGVLVVGDGKGPFTAYDTTGKKLGTLPADVNYSNTSESYIQYQDSATKKFGYLNADGSVALKAAYDQVYPVSYGLAGVAAGGKKGFVDMSGKVIIPLKYDYLFEGFDRNGLAIVGMAGAEDSPMHTSGKRGMVDRQGREVAPLIYNNLAPVSGGYYYFYRDGTQGWLTAEGVELTEDPRAPLIAPETLSDLLQTTRPGALYLRSEIVDGQAIVSLDGYYYLLTVEK